VYPTSDSYYVAARVSGSLIGVSSRLREVKGLSADDDGMAGSGEAERVVSGNVRMRVDTVLEPALQR
jgi:hypothetical protein